MKPVTKTITWRRSAALSVAPAWFCNLRDDTILDVIETPAGKYRWTYQGYTDWDTETGVCDTLDQAQAAAVRAGIRAGSIHE